MTCRTKTSGKTNPSSFDLCSEGVCDRTGELPLSLVSELIAGECWEILPLWHLGVW